MTNDSGPEVIAPPVQHPEHAQIAGVATIVVVLIVIVQLSFAGLLVLQELISHNKAEGQSGIYYLVIGGLLAGSWGLIWRRLWTIPIAVGLACALVEWIIEVLELTSHALGPMAGFTQLVGLIGALILGVMIAGQVAAIAIVACGRKIAQKSGRQRAIQLGEIAVLCLVAPGLYALDYVVPRQQKVKLEARRAARHAAEEEADRQERRTQQEALARFAAAVEAGEAEEERAAWSELRAMGQQNELSYETQKELAHHPDRIVREQLLKKAIEANKADGVWRMYGFFAEMIKNEPDPALRRLVVDFLIDRNSGPPKYVIDDDLDGFFEECLPFFAQIFADQSDENAKRREVLVRIIGHQHWKVENFLPFLDRVNQSDPNAEVRAAAAQATASIQKSVEFERKAKTRPNGTRYRELDPRIEVPQELLDAPFYK